MASLRFERVSKTFTMHLRGGTEIGVLRDLSFAVEPAECVVLAGPSGAGKSTVLRLAQGNYAADAGRIVVEDAGRETDLVAAPPREVMAVRRTTLGYVSQFLQVIPRVPALALVAEAAGSEDAARTMLARLNLPERFWDLPPATFSGGERQRVNIAISMSARRPVLLLDEPTASLDAANRDVVAGMIEERRAAGAAILAIFHDAALRERLATRLVEVAPMSGRVAA